MHPLKELHNTEKMTADDVCMPLSLWFLTPFIIGAAIISLGPVESGPNWATKCPWGTSPPTPVHCPGNQFRLPIFELDESSIIRCLSWSVCLPLDILGRNSSVLGY